jgi:hypothetical protein
MEIWKPVPVMEFSEIYEVSNLGRVRRKDSSRVLKPMRTGTKRRGSQRSKVRFSTTPRKDYDVAHLVLEAFVSAKPRGMQAMHGNDDSSDNRAANLKWGTPRNNTRDMAEKKRGGLQKIGRESAENIKLLRTSGVTGAAVAKMYGISQQRVCDIFKGRSIFTEVS